MIRNKITLLTSVTFLTKANLSGAAWMERRRTKMGKRNFIDMCFSYQSFELCIPRAWENYCAKWIEEEFWKFDWRWSFKRKKYKFNVINWYFSLFHSLSFILVIFSVHPGLRALNDQWGMPKSNWRKYSEESRRVEPDPSRAPILLL